jgi:hypothetical protein
MFEKLWLAITLIASRCIYVAYSPLYLAQFLHRTDELNKSNRGQLESYVLMILSSGQQKSEPPYPFIYLKEQRGQRYSTSYISGALIELESHEKLGLANPGTIKLDPIPPLARASSPRVRPLPPPPPRERRTKR